MSATRKQVKISLTVSVPKNMTAAQARKEVRSLITHQANWLADEGDVKVVKCGPVKGAAQ